RSEEHTSELQSLTNLVCRLLLEKNIFITNIEPDKCDDEQIDQLYRLRWRIEIIFKSWKSCFSMQALIHFFFFNDTATTEIYTLSLHDALPISALRGRTAHRERGGEAPFRREAA